MWHASLAAWYAGEDLRAEGTSKLKPMPELGPKPPPWEMLGFGKPGTPCLRMHTEYSNARATGFKGPLLALLCLLGEVPVMPRATLATLLCAVTPPQTATRNTEAASTARMATERGTTSLLSRTC